MICRLFQIDTPDGEQKEKLEITGSLSNCLRAQSLIKNKIVSIFLLLCSCYTVVSKFFCQ